MALKKSFMVPFIKTFTKKGAIPTDLDFENAAADFSVTPGVYEILPKPEPGSDIEITQICIVLENGGGGSQLRDFGNIPTLTNGIIADYEKDGVSFFTSNPLKDNLDLIIHSSIFNTLSFAGGSSFVFDIKLSNPFTLKGGSTDRVLFTVSDDVSALDGLFITTKGFFSTEAV